MIYLHLLPYSFRLCVYSSSPPPSLLVRKSWKVYKIQHTYTQTYFQITCCLITYSIEPKTYILRILISWFAVWWKWWVSWVCRFLYAYGNVWYIVSHKVYSVFFNNIFIYSDFYWLNVSVIILKSKWSIILSLTTQYNSVKTGISYITG